MNAISIEASNLVVCSDPQSGRMEISFSLGGTPQAVPVEVLQALQAVNVDPLTMFMEVGIVNPKDGSMSMYTHPYGLGLPGSAGEAWQQLSSRQDVQSYASSGCIGGFMSVRPRLHELTPGDVLQFSSR